MVKELRLAGISTIEDANRFLQEHSLPAINAKFAKPPLRPENAHVPLYSPLSLADIFCYETPRVVSNDYVVSYHRRLFQITRHTKPLPRPRTQVIVRELLDGHIKLLYQNTELAYVALSTPLHKEALVPCSV